MEAGQCAEDCRVYQRIGDERMVFLVMAYTSLLLCLDEKWRGDMKELPLKECLSRSTEPVVWRLGSIESLVNFTNAHQIE
jgi:hypothetical protein